MRPVTELAKVAAVTHDRGGSDTHAEAQGGDGGESEFLYDGLRWIDPLYGRRVGWSPAWVIAMIGPAWLTALQCSLCHWRAKSGLRGQLLCVNWGNGPSGFYSTI